MVRTSNENRDVAGTTNDTDQVTHERIMKTHSRSEYSSTSEELVDKNQEGFAIVITERHEKSIIYVSPSILTARCNYYLGLRYLWWNPYITDMK